MNKKSKPKEAANKELAPRAGKAPNPRASRATREFVESVVIAVILAFLFRTFEAEAFVIPTGSMAPTLMGRHMDVECPQCGYQFQVGASSENDDSESWGLVNSGVCPICRHEMTFDRRDPNQRSFTGDRILVSKFSYDLFEPERWDVIVFKYPGNAKQNYIKRLIGLPGETLRIQHGDIFVQRGDEADFRIARKEPAKLRAMLQLVDDTDYWAQSLIQADWPSRWQNWPAPSDQGGAWEWTFQEESGQRASQRFQVEGVAGQDTWLRYRHIVPTHADWERIYAGQKPAGLDQREGELIRDFYAYNTSESRELVRYALPDGGMHWVGDLALEADLDVKSAEGEVLFDIVEAGVHYTCRIDVKTGLALLSIDGGRGTFSRDDGSEAIAEVKSKAPTPLRGPGSYQVRFSNADNQLTLWIDGDPIAFDGPTTFQPTGEPRPQWTSYDPLDLAPAGIGVKGASIEASRLRVLRDIYYLALEPGERGNFDYVFPYDDETFPAAIREIAPGLAHYWDQSPYQITQEELIHDIFTDPRKPWTTSTLFSTRRYVEFTMQEDQFFPLGDNSPQSKDARIWETEPHVRRELLTGKALFIYWPHHWRRPIPFWPNFERMKFIR